MIRTLQETKQVAGYYLMEGWRREIEQNHEFHSSTEVGTVYIPHVKDKILRINQLLDMGAMSESCWPYYIVFSCFQLSSIIFAIACCPSKHRWKNGPRPKDSSLGYYIKVIR